MGWLRPYLGKLRPDTGGLRLPPNWGWSQPGTTSRHPEGVTTEAPMRSVKCKGGATKRPHKFQRIVHRHGRALGTTFGLNCETSRPATIRPTSGPAPDCPTTPIDPRSERRCVQPPRPSDRLSGRPTGPGRPKACPPLRDPRMATQWRPGGRARRAVDTGQHPNAAHAIQRARLRAESGRQRGERKSAIRLTPNTRHLAIEA